MSTTVSPEGLRSQRKNPTVLKADLSRIRERNRCMLVIVLEGKDDLAVYKAWFKRISEDVAWEPLVAGGKRNLLEFRDLVLRDQTGIKSCTNFIVDHDYDGLKGHVNGDDIYVLPSYSIENYLTDIDVFESFLMIDMQVIGDIDKRVQLVDLFEILRCKFIDGVRAACEILYAAKHEKVGNISIDEDLSKYFDISLDNVSLKEGVNSFDIVSTEHVVSEERLKEASAEFDRLNLVMWVRGKFMLWLYKKIILKIYEDRVSDEPQLFDIKKTGVRLSTSAHDMRSMASISSLPDGLKECFLHWNKSCFAIRTGSGSHTPLCHDSCPLR